MKEQLSHTIALFNSGPTSVLVPVMRRLSWSSPVLFCLINRMRHHEDPFCWGSGDFFWVDGYPRSANTFAAECLQIAFPDRKICSHSHAPLPVIDACRQEKPGMLVIREPKKAVVSYVIYTQYTLLNCLDKYIQFHEKLLPCRKSVYISDFSLTTGHPDAMLAGFSGHYGIELSPVPDRQSLEKEAMNRLEKKYTDTSGEIFKDLVPRPEKSRMTKSEEITSSMENSIVLRRMLHRCEALYDQFFACAHTADDVRALQGEGA